MHLNNFCNPGLFEDIEPLPVECLSADCLPTASQSPHCCSSTSSSLPAVLPLSSCFSPDSLPGGSSNATVVGSNEQQWELEQETELTKCSRFVEDTCGCKWANGRACSLLFTKDYYATFRSQASLLTREQLDLVILGSVMSTVNDGDVAAGRHKPAKRQRTALSYMHKGHHLCKTTFNFLYGVGKHRVPAIKKNFLEYGLETRIHGNSRKRPHNSLTWDMIINIVKFIQNFAERNAILLPGRIPTHKRDDIKLLPSSDSKKVLYTKS